jgi:hypothetical protein
MGVDELAGDLHALLDVLAEHDPEAREYQQDGSRRTVTPLSSETVAWATDICDHLDCQPKQCYRNAQLIATADDTATYCEGYTISADVPVPVQHAWVERDGVVVEVTFPDGPQPRSESVYFGVTYDRATVDAHLDTVSTVQPLAGR